MRRIVILVALIVTVSALILQSVHSQSKTGGKADQAQSKAPAKPDRSADESVIRTNIEQFTKAYNAGDAKGVAALFTTDGQIEDKEGNITEGRDNIAKVFGEVFQDSPKKKLEVFVDAIRFIGGELALETGTTKETIDPNEPPEYDRYTVLHVKRDGKWQMAVAREEEGPAHTSHERLQPLAWLVGEWVDDGGRVVVHSNCRWSEDGNYLLQEFKLQISGREAMNVSQRIGWDPHAKTIRAWVFDSEGGFGESVWTRDDSEWLIRATGVRTDGSTASATNHLIPTGTDGYIWRSTDRVVGGEVEPDVEVKVVRKPPPPK